MLAREGTSEGVRLWWGPWRERKAMGTAVCGVRRIVIGEEGAPQGVEMEREATGVKPVDVRELMPVPPMTAMWTGSTGRLAGGMTGRGKGGGTVVSGGEAGHGGRRRGGKRGGDVRGGS